MNDSGPTAVIKHKLAMTNSKRILNILQKDMSVRYLDISLLINISVYYVSVHLNGFD